jgi:hypothetical protein
MKTNNKNQIEKLGSQSAQCVETAKQQQADAPAKPTSTARQAVDQAVAKHSTPTGGDLTDKDNAEQAARAARVDTRLFIDFEFRKANRTLPTPKVLALLHQQAPAAYRLAEVVGRWVWVTFKEQPAAELRQTLSQIGFHWNRERQAWQHPCGKFSLGSNTDPHEKTTMRGAHGGHLGKLDWNAIGVPNKCMESRDLRPPGWQRAWQGWPR